VMMFPHPLSSDEDGLLAIGGELSASRLSLAYTMGIFPWYNHPPILWWYTHPRAILVPQDVKVAKSMRSVLRKPWKVTMDKDFRQVILSCKNAKRAGQHGTWITKDIEEAYQVLHDAGKAHSVEVWRDDALVGGLYGIVCGKIFCGESMFASEANTSKIALIWLARYLSHLGCTLIDCQQDTDHMKTMGSTLVDKHRYWEILKSNMLSDDMELSYRSFEHWKNLQVA